MAGTWPLKTCRLLSAVAILGLGLLTTGCNPEIDLSPKKAEIFRGRFVLEKDPNVVGGSDTDRVEFVIQGGPYSFQFQTFNSKVCDSKGTAYGFGTPRIRFTPSTVFVGNCDSLHVPQGNFISVFKGDSLLMNKYDTARSQRYQIDLTK